MFAAKSAATLWLNLQNRSDTTLYIHAHWWTLIIKESKDNSTRRAILHDYSPREQHDFFRVEPGQTLRMLMDADAAPEANGEYVAELDITCPNSNGAIPGEPFEAGGQLVSKPFELTFTSPAEEGPDKEKLDFILGNESAPEGETKLEDKDITTEMLRCGLRLGEWSKRWGVFEYICQHPREALTPDLVDFLARMGPANARHGELRIESPSSGVAPSREEVTLDVLLGRFAEILTVGQRVDFYRQVCQAIHYDWRNVTRIMRPFAANHVPVEVAAACDVYRMMAKRNACHYEDLIFTAQIMALQPGSIEGDHIEALALADRAVALAPDSIVAKYVLARLRKDKAAEAALIAGIKEPEELNSVAWDLVTKGKPSMAQARLAIKLATRAVSQAKDRSYIYHLWDTLGASYAAANDFENAWRAQEHAFSLCPKTEQLRPGFAERLTEYLLLKSGTDRQVQETAFLNRYHGAEDAQLRDALAKALRKHFGNDEKLEAKLTTPTETPAFSLPAPPGAEAVNAGDEF